jgi:hypothetical protein
MSLLGVLLVLSYLVASAGAAASTSAQTYWHTSDYYSIQFDGIGNGFISADLNLQGISTTPVNTLTLDIPYPNVIIYQIISENASNYGPCYGCVEPYYNNYNSNPQFVNYTTTAVGSSTLLTLHLKQPLVNNSQAVIYLFYSVRGLAQKTFQGYQFTFDGIIDNSALIQNAYASVQVPENMYLQGKPTLNVNYSAGAGLGAFSAATSAASAAALIAPIFSYSYQYHSSDLLPGEYFSISGLYGKSQALLYIWDIVAGIIIVVVVILLVRFFIGRRIKLVFSKKTQGRFGLARPLLTGILSGFLFEVAYYGIEALFSFLNSQYYYNSPLQILVILLALVTLGLSLFGLPLYLGRKYGWKEGAIAAIVSLVAAVIYSIIIIALFASPVVYPYAV